MAWASPRRAPTARRHGYGRAWVWADQHEAGPPTGLAIDQVYFLRVTDFEMLCAATSEVFRITR